MPTLAVLGLLSLRYGADLCRSHLGLLQHLLAMICPLSFHFCIVSIHLVLFISTFSPCSYQTLTRPFILYSVNFRRKLVESLFLRWFHMNVHALHISHCQFMIKVTSFQQHFRMFDMICTITRKLNTRKLNT